MEINIENYQNIICVDEQLNDLIKKVVEFVLDFEELNGEYEVSILFVDNAEIRKINFEQRGIDRETDCLSFPMLSFDNNMVFKDQYKNFKFKDYDLNNGNLLLGDIIISLEKAYDQSLEFEHKFEREVVYLTIHSLLHLLGYDHINDEEKKNMRYIEKMIIKKLGIFK